MEIPKEDILKVIDEIGWSKGPWTEHVWRMVVNGILDFRINDLISGFCDAHIHIDRCFTYSQVFFPQGVYLSEIADSPLSVKQDLIGELHVGIAYSPDSLRERMIKQVERLLRVGTREVWVVTDTTPDIELVAFDEMNKIKKEYSDRLDIKVACYPVFGLKNPLIQRDRLDILERAAETADFIVGLPEKDEAEDRIGFKGHVNILLDLGYKCKKEVHFHVDQGNSALQKESFRVIECLEGMVPEKKIWFTGYERPRLWLVHVISPSCYEADEFNRLLKLLVKYNIGVICCPSAAISMREMRSEKSPIHNSIARILEMLRAGVRVKFGTDNVNDMFVPSGTGLVIDEVQILSNIIRNYSPHIFAKLAMGIQLDNGDREIIARALHEKNKAWNRHNELISENYNCKRPFDF